jgi:hypothetical protein
MADPWMSQGVSKVSIGYSSSLYLSFCILANQTHSVRYFAEVQAMIGMGLLLML